MFEGKPPENVVKSVADSVGEGTLAAAVTRMRSCRPYRKGNIRRSPCFKGEKEMSPEVWVTKAGLYQG